MAKKFTTEVTVKLGRGAVIVGILWGLVASLVMGSILWGPIFWLFLFSVIFVIGVVGFLLKISSLILSYFDEE